MRFSDIKAKEVKRMLKFTNGDYDKLKWVAQYFLPALATFYFALSKIWGLPYGEEITGTIAALDTFIGVCLGISSNNYYKDKKDDSKLDDVL
jgi:hypothetical protein